MNAPLRWPRGRQILATQGDAQWIRERVGLLTTSNMAAAMAYTKKGDDTAERRQLKANILAERVTDRAVSHFVTPAMQWGSDTQPLAESAYEIATGRVTIPGGFWLHPTIQLFGSSPDSLVDEDGLCEYKCPTTATFISWRLAGVVPEEHKAQMTGELVVTGRDWCDFVAYDPRVPHDQQLFIRRFVPSAEERKAIEEAAIRLLAEIEAMFELFTATDPS
jgi:hypothetical protein